MSSHKRSSSRSADRTGQSATSKRPRRMPRVKEKSLVERINALPLAQFSTQYFFPQTARTIQSTTELPLSLSTWTEMPLLLREGCINLLETTSASHYRASERGWSRSKKLKEVRHPAMKYLLLLPPTEEAEEVGQIEGFLSFMITEEDGFEVIYCYELHLQPRLQGKGVGRKMMELMEIIGWRVGVEKAMLTVFRSNDRAVRAYGGWGYGVDEFSPEPRKLRDGTVKEPTYVILSKVRERFAREEPGQADAYPNAAEEQVTHKDGCQNSAAADRQSIFV